MFIDLLLPDSVNPSTSLLPKKKVSWCNRFVVFCFYKESFQLDGGFSTMKCVAPFITKIALATLCMTLSGVAFGAAMQIGSGYHTFSILKWYALGGAITGCIGSFCFEILHDSPNPNDY